MNIIASPSRFLLVPLMAISVGISGIPALGLPGGRCVSANTPVSCCHQTTHDWCAMACCQEPVSNPQQAPTHEPKPTPDRWDGKLAWDRAGVERHTSLLGRTRPLAVPDSSTPSLITQHIRLQV